MRSYFSFKTAMVANPARSQLNRENVFFPCPRSRPRAFGLYTQAENVAFSRVPLLPPYFRDILFTIYITASIHTVNRHRVSPSYWGHAVAYRGRSPPRVRRPRASSPLQVGSTSNGCCLPGILETQLANVCAPLFSHTHYSIDTVFMYGHHL